MNTIYPPLFFLTCTLKVFSSNSGTFLSCYWVTQLLLILSLQPFLSQVPQDECGLANNIISLLRVWMEEVLSEMSGDCFTQFSVSFFKSLMLLGEACHPRLVIARPICTNKEQKNPSAFSRNSWDSNHLSCNCYWSMSRLGTWVKIPHDAIAIALEVVSIHLLSICFWNTGQNHVPFAHMNSSRLGVVKGLIQRFMQLSYVHHRMYMMVLSFGF